MRIVLTTSGFDNFLQLLIAVIAFVIVLLLTYFTTKFIGNYQKANSVGTNFKTIETYRISNTKYLQILCIGKKYVVIAVCKDTITSITELSEEEVVIPEYASTQESFAKVLDKLKKAYSRNDSSVKDDFLVYIEKDKEDNGNDDSDKI